jgi:hypothetical protein
MVPPDWVGDWDHSDVGSPLLLLDNNVHKYDLPLPWMSSIALCIKGRLILGGDPWNISIICPWTSGYLWGLLRWSSGQQHPFWKTERFPCIVFTHLSACQRPPKSSKAHWLWLHVFLGTLLWVWKCLVLVKIILNGPNLISWLFFSCFPGCSILLKKLEL